MELYSYHVFLFPFQWHFIGKEMEDKTLEQRTCLKDFVSLFKGTQWNQMPYKTDTILNYNEFNYFYGMVRDVLFDQGNQPTDESIISNLFYNIQPDTHTYNFKVCTDGFKKIYKSYSLHIDSIILHLYSTGVGVLSFHLNNRIKEQSDRDDILNINQAGRRIYPPYFGMENNMIGTQAQYDFKDFSFGLDIVQQKELAPEFSVISDLHFDDFRSYRNPENFRTNPFQLPVHISLLFKGIPLTVDKTDSKSTVRKIYLNPLLDDRMFVLCWYGNDEIVNELKANDNDHCKDKDGNLLYLDNDWWYKFMFNDQKQATCQNVEMKRNLIKKHTYTRWSDYGTFYGVNRYSFVCLTGSLEHLKKPWVNAAFLVNHMQTMYYKLCELCLVQRACIIRFSEEVAGISSMKDNEKLSLTDRIGNLYQQYMRFVNRIYFREVTAQEQGIELYNMLQRHMQIERNVKDLDNEIKELHSYITLIHEQKQSRNIELLTIIGSLFIMPTFIISFVGMIIYPEYPRHLHSPWEFLLLSPLLVGPVIYYLIDPKRAKKWMWWLVLFTIGVGVTLLGFLLNM
jgi:hypothetical protein